MSKKHTDRVPDYIHSNKLAFKKQTSSKLQILSKHARDILRLRSVYMLEMTDIVS